jgi:hypothetical protein
MVLHTGGLPGDPGEPGKDALGALRAFGSLSAEAVWGN